jgi:hypothetical protein
VSAPRLQECQRGADGPNRTACANSDPEEETTSNSRTREESGAGITGGGGVTVGGGIARHANGDEVEDLWPPGRLEKVRSAVRGWFRKALGAEEADAVGEEIERVALGYVPEFLKAACQYVAMQIEQGQKVRSPVGFIRTLADDWQDREAVPAGKQDEINRWLKQRLEPGSLEPNGAGRPIDWKEFAPVKRDEPLIRQVDLETRTAHSLEEVRAGLMRNAAESRKAKATQAPEAAHV